MTSINLYSTNKNMLLIPIFVLALAVSFLTIDAIINKDNDGSIGLIIMTIGLLAASILKYYKTGKAYFKYNDDEIKYRLLNDPKDKVILINDISLITFKKKNIVVNFTNGYQNISFKGMSFKEIHAVEACFQNIKNKMK